MKALSIRQPWAILHAGKRVENREWCDSPGMVAQARRLIGQRIAIHAAAGVGTRDEFHDAAEFVIGRNTDAVERLHPLRSFRERWMPGPEMTRGAIVATATLAYVYEGGVLGHRRHDFGRCSLCGQENPTQRELLRGAPMGGGQCPKRDPWAIDAREWLILADVTALPVPIHYKGALGFFEVPDALLTGAT